MRVKDPFDEIDVAKRKAVLITACLIASAVLCAMVWPTMTGVIAIIVAFFVMIMLHELGHFTMAKRADMKVTEFFVGFGPRLWSAQRGETEYGLKAIPLGGYCKVIGMTNLDEVEPEDEPRTYRAKRWGPKVVMAAAGPATHFIIAIVMMFVVLFVAGDLRDTRATLTLSETTQGAAAAGLQAGDEIIAINGTQLSEWSEVRELISPASKPAKPGDEARIVVRRDDQEMLVVVTLNASAEDPTRIVAGVSPTLYTPQPGLLESAAMAPREVGQVGWESVKALGGMFSPAGISNYFRILSGDTSEETDQSKRFVSPIGLGNLAHDAVRSGWVTVFGLLISINIFIGLFNLVPLLPFDGGHIAVATYEQVASKIRRRKVQVDITKLMPITIAVLMVLSFIFLSSVFLDITKPIANPF